MALLSFPKSSFAAPCEQWVAKVVSVQGTVEVQPMGETQWQPVKINDTYCPGDTIRVQNNSRTDVSLANQSVLRLNANTSMTLEEVKDNKTSVVDMLKGAIHFFSRGPKSLEVQTPFTTAGVRGTEFLINVNEDKASLSVFEGEVLATNEAGSLSLTGGQSAIAEAGRAPVLHVVAHPRDAVHWALHYPPVLYLRPEDFQTGTDWQGMVRKSMENYMKGDLSKAFGSIEKAPTTNIHDSRFFVYRASLLLSVGRVEEAGVDIGKALNLNPNDSNSFALQAIIAVVQNENEKAFNMAQKAVGEDTNSATAQIALSYVQQARFDLEGARTSVSKAVRLDPENALAWARLAELWSSFGDLDNALGAAHKAVSLDPNLSRTQTVLGFAYLTQVKTILAMDAFEKAIVLDQADPLPRLGLGLAQIREGDLPKGRRNIEVAASLDPNNSLVRSYLGKAYFEEKRPKLNEREYLTAKELDPLDPTPWFYDAIRKQTTNRPAEALYDLEKAIELNDNRAVYRSRLLLDSDLAARSSSLARIYTDMGFQQLALVEGWKSVNTDPSNFSAHRFLADSYAALPRHKIARVSELLQSQLLQPINQTPIQPRLAESNLFLISAGGPGAISFNEFNPLFNRDGLTLQTNAFAGENSTVGGEGIVSGIYKKLSFSGGYTHFETEGFRPNNDQKDDIANAFVQAELSDKTSIQAEYRYRDSERGDLQLSFFPDDFFPGERTTDERNSYRLGARHAFSQSSIVLGSLIYQDIDFRVRDEEPLEAFFDLLDIKRNPESINVELQHLFRSRYFTLTSGIGHVNINDETRQVIQFTGTPDPFIPAPVPADTKHTNVYAYSSINLIENVTFSLGASGDFLDGDSFDVEDQDQFNPKFGVSWNPLPNTTIRAAAFRVLKRTLITDQTLEPTQVAGFNQFFDDRNGTESWRYGGAVEQKFSKNVFGGVEFSKRDLDVLFQDFEDPVNPVSREVDWDERLGRAYLFWTPHEWFALKAEYLFERLERDEKSPDGLKNVETHRVPLGINFFHPSGLSLSLTTTYFNQDGKFERFRPDPLGNVVFESGNDNFWITDVALSYRLPKRYGLISVGATNLFDTEFKYQDTDPDNPIIQPERVFFARVTLSF